MELVKFTDDTYRSLSNDTIITSSSADKREWCALKGNVLTAPRKAFLEKVVVELVYKSMRSPTAKV